MQKQTTILKPDHKGIAEAAKLLVQGELVSFPTETVYGLGGDATNDHAVAAIFDAKQRDKVRKHMSKVGVGFVIPSVIFQKITEVFPLEEEGGSHALHGAPDLVAEPEAV